MAGDSDTQFLLSQKVCLDDVFEVEEVRVSGLSVTVTLSDLWVGCSVGFWV